MAAGEGVLAAVAAQEELRTVADELLRIEDRLRTVRDVLPRSPDEDAMFEGRVAWDLPTELRAVVECVLEEQLRRAIESLERASRLSESDLREGSSRGGRELPPC